MLMAFPCLTPFQRHHMPVIMYSTTSNRTVKRFELLFLWTKKASPQARLVVEGSGFTRRHSVALKGRSTMVPLQLSFKVAVVASVIPFGTTKVSSEAPVFTSITDFPGLPLASANL